MLDFRIILEARNPARRCSRRYRVEAGTDLFGSWVVEITYGRIGTAGRSPGPRQWHSALRVTDMHASKQLASPGPQRNPGSWTGQ